VLCGLVLVLVGLNPGVSSAAPAPITDYASYPPAFPAGCTVDGAGVVPGVQFTVNGQTASDLRTLQIVPGDTITMTWTSLAPGCESLGLGLSVKISQASTFNIADNQYLQSFTYCGPGGDACTGSLAIQLPPAAVVPCYQLDAHIGAPLAIVGPSGSYYGDTQRASGTNMLISAQNGGSAPCDVPPCATDATIPAAAVLCAAQVTTTVPVAPPTTAPPAIDATTTIPSCANNPAIAASSPDCQPCPPGQTMSAAGQCLDSSGVAAARQSVVPATPLPATGSHTAQPLVLLAGVLLAVGAPLTLLSRRTAVARRRMSS
jgi:hypothetical protein